MSNPSPYSRQVDVHNENAASLKAWPLHWDLLALFCCVAAMAQFHLSLVSLQINTKLFCVITFILWWNVSILIGVVSSWMTMPPFIEHEGSLNSLMRIICYDLCSHHVSAQLSSCGRFWTDVLHSSVHHNQTPNEWISFGRTVFVKVHWSYSGSMWLANTLLKHLLVSLLICHLCIYLHNVYKHKQTQSNPQHHKAEHFPEDFWRLPRLPS